jgi:hypothetical protein
MRDQDPGGLGYMASQGPNGRVDTRGNWAGRNSAAKWYVIPLGQETRVEGTIQYRVTVLPSGYLRETSTGADLRLE